jgi:dTDP-4-amino-4,6-dideoxygalactose transaminase
MAYIADRLAIFGGDKSVKSGPGDMFTWPIITEEDEEALVKVLHDRSVSGTGVTREFEDRFAGWIGSKYALGFCNGTMAVYVAMYACGLGHGDELITPSVTYWASSLAAYSLGATPVFADVDPHTMCIDPNDIERSVSEKTKAIMAVHYLGHPADMDNIMRVAEKYGVAVIEDVSHAQGGHYKGKRLGTFGRAGAMSLMGGKSFAIGEAGMMVTDDRLAYERAIAASLYERYDDRIADPGLLAHKGLPLLGVKGRPNQYSSAIGLVQLKYYDERIREIRKSMNYFWDLLDGVPGLLAHRVDEKDGSDMAGWYEPHGLYDSEALGGLSVSRFCEAVRSEGFENCYPGCNTPLHTHSVFHTADIYGQGKPTRVANAARDVRELDRALPNSEALCRRVYSIPWFKHYRPDIIKEYADAFKKATLNHKELLGGDKGNPENMGYGRWNFYRAAAQ